MIRIAALIAGVLLTAGLAVRLMDMTIPVPKYRKGDYTDYLFYGQTLLAIYGSVLLGVAVYWIRAKRSGQPPFAIGIFKAGIYGVLAVSIAFFGGIGLYSLAKYGSFAKAMGNLWGALAMLWWILGALLSAGIALLFYGLRSPASPIGAGPAQGPQSSPPTAR